MFFSEKVLAKFAHRAREILARKGNGGAASIAILAKNTKVKASLISRSLVSVPVWVVTTVVLVKCKLSAHR